MTHSIGAREAERVDAAAAALLDARFAAAKEASRKLARATSAEKNAALATIAAQLRAAAPRIVAANAEDLARGRAEGRGAHSSQRCADRSDPGAARGRRCYLRGSTQCHDRHRGAGSEERKCCCAARWYLSGAQQPGDHSGAERRACRSGFTRGLCADR